jgi:hypothetical protein
MPKKPLPQFVSPMAAASAKEPFDGPDWICEPKLWVIPLRCWRQSSWVGFTFQSLKRGRNNLIAQNWQPHRVAPNHLLYSGSERFESA